MRYWRSGDDVRSGRVGCFSEEEVGETAGELGFGEEVDFWGFFCITKVHCCHTRKKIMRCSESHLNVKIPHIDVKIITDIL